ncbi:MAG: META domain-containing protein [Pseudolabrys sp.]|nr:META domain-containing protein [Pseudolabrys sp.]
MKEVRRFAVVATACAGLLAGDFAIAQDFPFDQVLNMDVRPMAPSKRKPSLTIAANGTATIDLWCNSIEGKADVSGDTITIAPAELPAEPPAAISYGQCAPDRVQADQMLREALSQVSAWKRQGNAIVLSGTTTMRFYPSTN